MILVLVRFCVCVYVCVCVCSVFFIISIAALHTPSPPPSSQNIDSNPPSKPPPPPSLSLSLSLFPASLPPFVACSTRTDHIAAKTQKRSCTCLKWAQLRSIGRVTGFIIPRCVGILDEDDEASLINEMCKTRLVTSVGLSCIRA